MSQLTWLTSFAQDESAHFALSSAVALLAFSLTWIICTVSLSLAGYGTRRRMSTAAGYGILGISLLAGLACALLAHVWLDGLSIWLSTPLGPPLVIVK
jgi:hypothetical protein